MLKKKKSAPDGGPFKINNMTIEIKGDHGKNIGPTIDQFYSEAYLGEIGHIFSSLELSLFSNFA